MKIGIVGLGLIGGSMAKAIKSKTDHQVLGLDTNEETMQLALLSGSIDEKLTGENLSSCSLVMIAIAPQALLNWVQEHAADFGKDAVLVDLCGVKRMMSEHLQPIAKANGFKYIGGHPMAGKEVAGFQNAVPDLYTGASMILCPEKDTDIVMLDRLKAFFLSLGFGSVVFSTPEEHDAIISYTSQLAHVVSSAYIKSPTSRKRMGFTAGSYKDMTRVARLNPDLWTELFLADADNLGKELDFLIQNLTACKDAIQSGDAAALRSLLAEGNKLKQTEPYEDHKGNS